MSLEHSPSQNEINDTPVMEAPGPLSIEGENGMEVVPTFADLESFQGALAAHSAGIEELDREEGAIMAELDAPDLAPEKVVEKTQGVSKRNTAGKVATWFAILAGAGVFAQAAEAGTLRDAERGIQRHNTNEMQIARLQAQFDETYLKRDQIIAEIERLEGRAQTPPAPNQMPASKEQKMDTAYDARVAELEVQRLSQEEALMKEQLSDAMRAAKMRKIEADFAAKLATLADTANTERAKTIDRVQDTNTRLSERDEKKVASLEGQLQRLDTRAQQIKMKINGKEVQGTFDTIDSIIKVFK